MYRTIGTCQLHSTRLLVQRPTWVIYNATFIVGQQLLEMVNGLSP